MTFTGTDVAEWLQAATIAIVSKTPVELLWQAVPAFPTRSEIWLKLLERREADLATERFAAGVAASQPGQRNPVGTHWRRPGSDHTLPADLKGPDMFTFRKQNPAAPHAQPPAPLVGHERPDRRA